MSAADEIRNKLTEIKNLQVTTGNTVTDSLNDVNAIMARDELRSMLESNAEAIAELIEANEILLEERHREPMVSSAMRAWDTAGVALAKLSAGNGEG